jgi:dTDP-4-amino-4,6-dideoxygalactose transaminase
VITVPNSFLATCSSIVFTGAKPVFVDVGPDMNIDPDRIAEAITPKTKAILPVHWTGRPANMSRINSIAREHNLYVIEDAAQAVGAQFEGYPTGSLGTIGCFSLHPLKNLSIPGDGGMITTNSTEIYNHLRVARNHGLVNRDACAFFSPNSRLDTLHAAILNVKMNHLDAATSRRREIASKYHLALQDLVHIPVDDAQTKSVYHTYIVQTPERDRLMAHLTAHGIQSKIHYPIPIHLQKAAEFLGYREGDFPMTEAQTAHILSLPVFPELTNAQVDYVCETIQDFFK